jgi:hypothetical protein
MIITITLVVVLFLIALVVGEVLFRTGQAGIIALGIVFGFNNFRPGELTRAPFYALTMTIAAILAIVVVVVSVAIS